MGLYLGLGRVWAVCLGFGWVGGCLGGDFVFVVDVVAVCLVVVSVFGDGRLLGFVLVVCAYVWCLVWGGFWFFGWVLVCVLFCGWVCCWLVVRVCLRGFLLLLDCCDLFVVAGLGVGWVFGWFGWR